MLCDISSLVRLQPADESVRVVQTSPIRVEDGSDNEGGVYDNTVEIPGEQPAGTRRKYPVRAPSKLEQKIMADARQRQRDNVTTTQVVLGREYKGSGFTASPASIDFVDFDVGVTRTIRFVMTNVSLTFNSFKSQCFLRID